MATPAKLHYLTKGEGTEVTFSDGRKAEMWDVACACGWSTVLSTQKAAQACFDAHIANALALSHRGRKARK
jgi:hypothetical protein